MKFTASQADLSSALKTISRAVSNGRTHKVLAGALLTATSDGNLAVTGYDLELGITTTITASVETPGSTVIPHRLLSEITSRLDGPLTVSVADAGDRCDIASTSGSYSLSCDAADDFPDLPTLYAATVPVWPCKACCRRCCPRAPRMSPRPSCKVYASSAMVLPAALRQPMAIGS